MLANDVDPDSSLGDGKSVIAVRTGGIEGSGTSGTLGLPLQGLHGSLTVSANGTYTYTVNNADPQVEALRASDTLFDSFNYTMTDSLGLSDVAMLTVTIQGADDNPVFTSPADGNDCKKTQRRY